MLPTAYPLFIPNLGMGELAIIFVIILIVFGPGKLPQVMRSMGEGFRQFKDATNSATGSGDASATNTDDKGTSKD